MVRRIAFTFSRLVAWLLVLAVVGLAVLGLALQAGPIPLTWLTPYVERALSPGDGPARVTLGETQLRLGEDRVFELVAVDVRVGTPDGKPALHLPEITVGLSVAALFKHRLIAPERLVIEAPRLTLARRADGSIGLGASAAEPSNGASASPLNFEDLAGLIAADPHPSEPLSWLEQLRIVGGQAEFDDRVAGATLHARAADLVLERREQGLGLRLQFRLGQPERAASIVVTGAHEVATGRIALSVEFEDLAPPALAAWMAGVPVEGLRLWLDGWMAGTISQDLALLAPLQLAITEGRGVVDLPELLIEPLPVDMLQMRAQVAQNLDAADVDQLQLATRDATLSGRGAVAWRDQEISLSADLEVRNVAASDLASFWPPGAAPEARAWVIENITAGVVPYAQASIELQPGDLGEPPIPEGAINGRLEFDDLTLRYFETLPPLTGVDGSATFTARRMDFAVAGGEVGALRVQDGSVTITGIGIKGRDTTQLEVVADIEGPFPDALALIDHPPLGFARKLGVAPDDTAGDARVALRIGLPLHREVDESELRIAADALLTDAAIQGLAGRIDLTDGRFDLHADNQAADLGGAGAINGVPFEHIAWHEDFGDAAASPRRFELRGEVPVAALQQLGLEPPIPLEGAVGLDAAITEAAQQHTAELALDLQGLATALPWLDWQKPAGAPGRLELTLTMPDEGPIQVEEFELVSDGLEAAGQLVIETEPLRLERLNLTRLHTGATAASVLLRRTDPSGYDVTIDAERLNLDPLLDGESLAAGLESAETEARELQLQLSADHLVIGGRALSDVAANAWRDRYGWRSADVSARVADGAPLHLTLATGELEQALTLTVDGLGELMEMLDQAHRVEGGRVELNATIFEQQPRLSADGELKVREFTVLDAPILARLLTLASFTGIRNLLGGEGIHFDTLELPFELRAGVLTINKGRMSGSQVGLTLNGEVNLDTESLDLDGTLVPVYTLNRLIGRIPLIGTILSGAEGEGAFAATYQVTGSTAEPTVTVNPLAVLAPGLLRELFSGILEGKLEPPDVPQGRD